MSLTHSFRLVLFDFDGTLVDSQASILFCMGEAFEAHDFARPSDERVRRIVGLSLEQAIGNLLPQGVGSADVLAVSESYRRAFWQHRNSPEFHEPLYPGVLEILDRLAHPEVHLGIATGKNRRGLTASLERHGLSDRFSTLQTPDNAPGKPHPGMVLQAMEFTAILPEETLVIGDTSFDMEMARNAGVTRIGVNWGYHPEEDLRTAGAMAVLNSFDELLGAMAALSSREAGSLGQKQEDGVGS